MADDITLDTNVLMHADDPRQAHQAACQALLEAIESSDRELRVDEGFTADPATNRSKIGSEYSQRLVPGSRGSIFIIRLAESERIQPVEAAKKAVRDKVRHLVWDPTDRVFVEVSCGSQSRLLCSQDDTHFNKHTRHAILKELSVSILHATEL